jgi:dynamin 1-like protein
MDINNGMRISDAIEKEKKYFQTHQVYSKCHEKLGIQYMRMQLNKILVGHIKKCLPSLV